MKRCNSYQIGTRIKANIRMSTSGTPHREVLIGEVGTIIYIRPSTIHRSYSVQWDNGGSSVLVYHNHISEDTTPK